MQARGVPLRTAAIAWIEPHILPRLFSLFYTPEVAHSRIRDPAGTSLFPVSVHPTAHRAATSW